MFPHPSTVSLHNLMETHPWGATMYALAMPVIYHHSGSVHELLSTYTIYLEIIWVAACVNRAFHWKSVSSQTEGGLVGNCDKVLQANDTPNSSTSAMPACCPQMRETSQQTAVTFLLSQKQKFTYLFKVSWLLKYTHVILTIDAAMVCFNGILFSINLPSETRNG